MKKATKYLKHLFSAIVAAVKARSTAVGTKASSLQMRLIVLGIMRNKKLLLSAIQKKIHANEDKQDVVEATAGDKHVAVVDDDATAQAKAEGDFLLEDQIDHVADVFIRRFHEQMRLQKLESFKRFCEMLERGA
uniref:Uncharacterized protein n=1 Tax=Zea mays TaxID=4577 RepID=B6TGX1_MAIZE|nr:hypothetical protein [Zea mays]